MLVGVPTRSCVEFSLQKSPIRDREKVSRSFHCPPLHPSSGWGAKRFTVKRRNSDKNAFGEILLGKRANP
ncbi:hypothetical protein DLM78_15390 [Leptospira stimsonii]|uniref:Uncharacterized protein n=1 Tax=Leptospira stimsonii TaxID=2202203 RepID=A0A8B3CMX6_9LEPT|nr:hypothetical protein DLM78_15390 [Leptospira stimsonii]